MSLDRLAAEPRVRVRWAGAPDSDGTAVVYWMQRAQRAWDNPALDDRYELDGRDPNGYTNIAWAIGGKHDRPWPSRPIYGTVRSMSFASTSKKFDANRYIERWTGLPGLL